jgi:hypothetical protein
VVPGGRSGADAAGQGGPARVLGVRMCITIAPSASDIEATTPRSAWQRRPASRTRCCARRRLRAPPIAVEEIKALVAWLLRGKEAPSRVKKTFMFTDIERSTNLVVALGDEAWHGLLRCTTRRCGCCSPSTVVTRS